MTEHLREALDHLDAAIALLLLDKEYCYAEEVRQTAESIRVELEDEG